MQTDEAGTLIDAGGVTLVVPAASKRGASGVGSPALTVPEKPCGISRPTGLASGR
jgi:hypothetical protein